MKNKGFKITAIILTLVAVIVTHPFLRLEAKEITSRPIVLDRTQVITNSSGQLIFDGSQISYNYSISNAQSTSVQNALNFPVIYICDLIINLTEPVSAALITINFKTAATNNYPLNFIVEHGRVTTSNYNTLTVQALDTNIVYIKLIFSAQQIIDNYSYPSISSAVIDPLENEWVQYGYQYFQIQSATMTSATQYQGEYMPKINSILASVDGLESLMQSLVTSTSDIDTNIAAISNVLTGISNKIDSLNTVSWNNISSSWVGYTTDLTNYNSTDNSWYDPGYFVWVNNITNEQKKGLFRIIIPIRNVSMDELKFYQIWSGVLQEFTIEKYIFFYNRENTTIYFYLNDHYGNAPNGNYRMAIQCDKRTYIYNASDFRLGYITQDNLNYWTIYKTINDFMQLQETNNSLARIIQLLENMNINVTYQDVTNIVNNYDINIDQIFNVENNINTQLQQQMQNYNPDNTGILQQLNDSSILLKSVLNQINGIQIFTIPITIALVGIVLLAIVG